MEFSRHSLSRSASESKVQVRVIMFLGWKPTSRCRSCQVSYEFYYRVMFNQLHAMHVESSSQLFVCGMGEGSFNKFRIPLFREYSMIRLHLVP